MKTGPERSSVSNHILVVNNDEIMGAGLENLLSNEETLDVWGCTVQNEAALIDEIWRLRPDTIILTAESHMTDPARLLELLSGYGRIRIILVSINSNLFEIYDRQQVAPDNWVSFLTKLRAE
ncbi:MAG: response regulator transcription factor [Ardenticatenaceae bacterium]|nr:response regulator transcription factor [Ardenticatenaceae bacterium]MCB9445211.1 response regulator transcription factor [Ardenticatenaceae bacterium]